MNYTRLAPPFDVSIDFDGSQYEARVTYMRSSTCENLFSVDLKGPKQNKTIRLKETPVRTPEFEYAMWVDEKGKHDLLYQEIGANIAKHMRTNLGIYLIDMPVVHGEENSKTHH